MFIVFGEKTVKKPVEEGLRLRRSCPQCRRVADMQEFRWRRYFTLFFVPVFPLEGEGKSTLVCPHCESAFAIQDEDYLEGARQATASVQRKRVVVNCPYCDEKLRIPNLDKALVVTCPHCGRQFEVKKREGIEG